LKQVYVAEPQDGTAALPVPALSQVVLVLLALAVVGLGCAPDVLISRLLAAVNFAGL